METSLAHFGYLFTCRQMDNQEASLQFLTWTRYMRKALLHNFTVQYGSHWSQVAIDHFWMWLVWIELDQKYKVYTRFQRLSTKKVDKLINFVLITCWNDLRYIGFKMLIRLILPAFFLTVFLWENFKLQNYVMNYMWLAFVTCIIFLLDDDPWSKLQILK